MPIVTLSASSRGERGGEEFKAAGALRPPGLNYAASFSAFFWPLMRLRTVSEGWAPFEIQ
jgi:hypothetical protein